jgi:hypothetical protein
MPITFTPKLGLGLQDQGEANWDDTERQTFQRIEDRLCLSGSTDPNTATESFYVGQPYFQTTANVLWFATAVGNPGTWVKEGDGYFATQTLFALMQERMLSSGRFASIAAGQARLTMDYSRILAEIGGTIRLTSADITFDMATDLVGGETSSTWYYCYLLWNGTTLAKAIDSVAPNVVTGLHPTPGANPPWRYVGSFYNNAAGDIQPFFSLMTPYGRASYFKYLSAAMRSTDWITGATGTYTLRNLPINVSAPARAALVSVGGISPSFGNGSFNVAGADANGLNSALFPGILRSEVGGQDDQKAHAVGPAWLAVNQPAPHQIAVANTLITGTSWLAVSGWLE